MWRCHYTSHKILILKNIGFNEHIETNVPWHYVYLKVEPITYIRLQKTKNLIKETATATQLSRKWYIYIIYIYTYIYIIYIYIYIYIKR